MDRKMATEYVARRKSEGADPKTIYCELRSMGIAQDDAMSCLGSGASAAPQQNPYSSPQASNLAYGGDQDLYRAAMGVQPDPAWVKVTAIIILVLAFVVYWGLGAYLLLYLVQGR